MSSRHPFRSRHPFLSGLASIRAFLAAFVGSFGWLIWELTHETNRFCYGPSHYAWSAAIVAIVVIALTVASRRPWRAQHGLKLIGEAAATAVRLAVWLSPAGWFVLVVGCSGG